MEINSSYDKIKELIKKTGYVYGKISKLQYLASYNNIILTISDLNKKRYNAEVYYDIITHKIFPPKKSMIRIIIKKISIPPKIKLDDISSDLLNEIILKLNIRDIINLCLINKFFN